MPAYLTGVAGSVPANRYKQDEILEVMKAWHGGDRRVGRLLGGVYRASAIEGRHSVIDDFQPGSPGGFFFDPDSGAFLTPTTGARNARYVRDAGPLAACAAERSLNRAEVAPASVTHLVTASCTGFFAPGPDIELIERLGLPVTVERFHLGFMGCYAAFPALKLARSISVADPSAVVLVVCVELCTLHLQARSDSDSLLAGSVFADGAAAGVVSSSEPRLPGYRLDSFASTLVGTARDDMAWTIGDSGFEMVLSQRIPDAVEGNVAAALGPLLEGGGAAKDVDYWAVHPGGRAVLDAVERSLDLPPQALAASRSVLGRFGNMSSATVLFVLERLREQRLSPDSRVAALAFGPGLAVEGAMLTAVG